MGGCKHVLFRNRRIIIVIIITLLPAIYTMADGLDSSKWIQTTSPINSDLKFLTFSSPQTGIACGKQILFYKNDEWHKYPAQPPVSIELVFPLDTNLFFIASKNKNQESELYYGNGKHWKKIWIPLANVISSMYFTNKENGVIAGFGEIALLRNNQWQWLPPLSNESISSIRIDNDSIIWAHSLAAGLFKYDGKWTKIEGSEKASSIQFHLGSIYLLGDDFLGIVDSNDSITLLSTGQDMKKVLSFFVINENEIIAVGQEGSIMHFKNGEWKRMESGVTEYLNAIWMIDENTGWIVGNNGVLLHLTSAEIEQFDPDYWRGFEIITFNSFAKVVDDEYGVIAADFNNDGLVDIFTCGLYEANHLYINSGNNIFVDKAQQWNVSGAENVNLRELNLGACAGDFDNDGDDDLYVSVLNGSNKLYKNIRGNYFVDYSDISNGIGKVSDRTNAVISGDVDNDSDLDIFITNENSTNRLFLNNGAGIFSEATESVGLVTNYGGTGCSFGDIDNDGDMDLFVTNWSAENILYRNLLKESGQLVFENITKMGKVGGVIYSKSNAVVFSDIDNDADLDLFITNRKTSNKLYLNDGGGIFTDMTTVLIDEDSLKSYGAVIADFDGDGFKDIYVSNVGNNVFYKNIKGKRFVDNTLKYGAEIEGYSTGSAAADFDNNGNTDLYIANYLGESSAILRNNLNNQQYIKVAIEGIENNRSGIGVKIYVYKEEMLNQAPQLISYTEISGGSGYASMNQRFLPIPVPGQKFVDVKIVFPTGVVKTIKHIKTGSSIVLADKSGFNKALLKTSRWFLLLVKDPHMTLKLLTWLFVLLIIVFSMRNGSKRYRWSLLNVISFTVLLVILFYLQSGYFEYKNVWFSSVLPVLSVVVLIVLVRLYFERNRVKKLAVVEQEQIREKLSRDLHDDLASTVSTIAIYLTLIRYNLNNNEEKLNELLTKTTVLVSDAASAITDLIWAINPKPQSLDNLIIRINNNFSTLFREQGISFATESKTNIEHIILGAKVKQNIYLIIKEALNNILKYAGASSVKVAIENRNQEIYISIKDDGTGFDLSTVKNKGHGLTNMNIRADEIKAYFEIKSIIGEGTEIILVFKPN